MKFYLTFILCVTFFLGGALIDWHDFNFSLKKSPLYKVGDCLATVDTQEEWEDKITEKIVRVGKANYMVQVYVNDDIMIDNYFQPFTKTTSFESTEYNVKKTECPK